MITKNGKELLNLENSVERLKQLVEQHYAIDRVIADFGITMVNDPLTQSPEVLGLRGTKWGEAYPVGYGTPYDIWVWTRPNPSEENVALGGWLNIGPLAIRGPAGKDGVGERGEPGRTPEIYAGEYYTEVANPEPGDYFLDKDSGDLYKYTQFGGWGLPIANLKGAPGESIQGPPGQTAPIITLLGIVEGTDELPPAGPNYVGKGYIVSFESGIRTVYTVMEDEIGSGTYSWKIGGSISGYSVIEAGGEVVSEWNADTKLDKVATNTSGLYQAYTIDTTGQQTTLSINPLPSDWSIARRYDGGRLRVGTPSAGNDATNKAYVDSGFVPKLEIAEGSGTFAYIAEANGKTSKMQIQYGSPLSWTLVPRGEGGRVVVGTPKADNDATTKKYVDDAVANLSPKLYQHNLIVYGRGPDSDENMWSFGIVFSYISSSPTKITNYWNLYQALSKNGTQAITFFPTQGYIDGETIIRATLNSSGWIFETGYGVNTEDTYYVFFRDGEHAESNGSVDDTVSPIL